jgi:hypothetical protein
MKLMTDGGIVVLLNLFRYSIISVVWRPTDTAAYNEYDVNLYSWINSGLLTGFNIKNKNNSIIF